MSDHLEQETDIPIAYEVWWSRFFLAPWGELVYVLFLRSKRLWYALGHRGHCCGQDQCWMHSHKPWCRCSCRWCRVARLGYDSVENDPPKWALTDVVEEGVSGDDGDIDGEGCDGYGSKQEGIPRPAVLPEHILRRALKPSRSILTSTAVCADDCECGDYEEGCERSKYSQADTGHATTQQEKR